MSEHLDLLQTIAEEPPRCTLENLHRAPVIISKSAREEGETPPRFNRGEKCGLKLFSPLEFLSRSLLRSGADLCVGPLFLLRVLCNLDTLGERFY